MPSSVQGAPRRTANRWFAALLCCLGLGGCGTNFLTVEQSQRTYLLDTRPPPVLASTAGSTVLLVANPRAEPGFDTSRMAYTRAPAALDYFNESSWVDAPARMLQTLAVQTLEDTRAFKAVLAIPAANPPDLRLDLTLIRLQQEFLQQPSRVRLTLRAKLIDVATGQILATQLFEAMETAASEDAYGGVQAANRAVARVLGEITNFVLNYLPATAPVARG